MRSLKSHGFLVSAAGLTAAAVAAACIGAATPVHAAMLATDNADNYTSFAANSTTANGGTGFGTWNFKVANNNSPPYVGAYLASNKSQSIASSNGGYWGFYANSGTATVIPSVNAYRPFKNSAGTAIGTLRADQEFDLSMAQNAGGLGGNPGVAVGFSLNSVSSGTYTPVFSITFGQQAGSPYSLITTVTDASGATTYTSKAYNEPGTNAIDELQLQAGVEASFALGANNSYTLSLAPAKGNTSLTSPQIYTGTISGSINAADIIVSNPANNFYANQMGVSAVPEPAALALLGVAAGGLWLSRRRKSV